METMVRMGELAISDTPGDVLVSLGLGSCIGLALVDKRAGVAGLAHIVLPETTGSPKPEAMNKFADHAVPALVDGMVERGASRVFLQAALVGGASMFAGTGLEVGQRNAEAVRELVAKRRVPVVAGSTMCASPATPARLSTSASPMHEPSPRETSTSPGVSEIASSPMRTIVSITPVRAAPAARRRRPRRARA